MRRLGGLLVGIVVASAIVRALIACTGSDPEPATVAPDAATCTAGSEGCACTTAKICNPPLECHSDLCVAGGGTDSGTDSTTTDTGGGDTGTCLTVFKGGQDLPSGIVATSIGLAWVNLGGTPGVVFTGFDGLIKNTVQATNANGAIAYYNGRVVWADGTSVKTASPEGLSVVTPAMPGFNVGSVGLTSQNVYFTNKDGTAEGLYYCSQVGGPYTPDAGVFIVGESTGNDVWGLANANSNIYWADSRISVGGVRFSGEANLDASSFYPAAAGRRTHFVTVGNTTPFWTTRVQGSVQAPNTTIATGTPPGAYFALATDGTSVFFQAYDSSGDGGIYAVAANASSAAGKFIATAKFPQTVGAAGGVTFGNGHFYWTDQTTGSIWAWNASCPF